MVDNEPTPTPVEKPDQEEPPPLPPMTYEDDTATMLRVLSGLKASA